jgi:hypothetical protein
MLAEGSTSGEGGTNIKNPNSLLFFLFFINLLLGHHSSGMVVPCVGAPFRRRRDVFEERSEVKAYNF